MRNAVIACVEIGGSGTQTVIFDAGGVEPTYTDGVAMQHASAAAIAVPGIVKGMRVVAASNLGWYDVDPAERLGIEVPVVAVRNDAEAAALGEAVLRGVSDVVYVGVGTGVGGAVVREGTVVAGNLFGHAAGYSDLPCPCGRDGCLETVAAGWALPTPVPGPLIHAAGIAIARAIRAEHAAAPALVVVGGGLARAYPELVAAVTRALPDRRVEPSAAPAWAKSAAPWGLWRLAGGVAAR